MKPARITNMTASVNLNMIINTDLLVSQGICRHFNPGKFNKSFNGVIYKSVATAQIYKNGKINIMGARTQDQAIQVYAELCRHLKIRPRRSLMFSNFCSTLDLGCQIPRDELFSFLQKHPMTKSVLLEPEIFPPIKWESKLLPSTINIFRTGKINSTGNKSVEQAFASLISTVKIIAEVSYIEQTEKVFVAFVSETFSDIHLPGNETN